MVNQWQTKGKHQPRLVLALVCLRRLKHTRLRLGFMCGTKGKPMANQGQTKGKHQDVLGQPLVCLRFTLGLMQKTKGKPRLNRWQTKGKHQPLVYTWLYKNIYMYKLIIINSKPMANQVHNCAFGLHLVCIWFMFGCSMCVAAGLPLVYLWLFRNKKYIY
jgi:hypothetical protein